MRIILAILLTFLMSSAFGQTVDTNAVDGRIYVRTIENAPVDLGNYNNSDPALNAILSLYGVSEVKLPFGGLNAELDRTFEFTFTQESSVLQLITDLEALAYIEYAEKKPLFKTSYDPNDDQPSQWALTKIQAFDAWDISIGDANVTIAIVDNAVSTVHEDLQANIWVNSGEIPNNFIDDDLNGYTDDYMGYDVSDGDSDPNPPGTSNSSSPFTHGTHCAGIASASTDNGVGIAALGFNTSIIPVKCAPDNSATEGNELPNAYDGVYYAIQAGADIISMSWGGTGSTITGQSLISAANSMGIVLIAAAGNADSDVPHYPAAYPEVISVGATNSMDMRTWFSNYGTTVDVMAPGANMFSTLSGNGNEYGVKSGTSMACPLVAGLAALVLTENPLFTPDEVKTAIENGCDTIDLLNPGYEGLLGAGRINAYKTLNEAANLTPSVYNEVHVYPNPTEKELFIRSMEHPEQISVTSLDGKKVPFRLDEDSLWNYRITPEVSNGVYIVNFQVKNEYFSERIIFNP